MAPSRKRVTRFSVSVLAVLAVGAALAAAPVGGGAAGAAAIPRPEGAGPPVAASGMGTQAALDNPRCRHDDPKYGPYGRFDSTQIGGGPVCVKEWKTGADNGGATAQGVTKDRITIVAVILNDEQLKTDPVAPKHRADNSAGTYQDAIYDYVLPLMKFHETWGRDLEIKFYPSSGDDEAAQRADLVAIKAIKPFAVMMLAQPTAAYVLEGGLAAAKIPVMGYHASAKEMNDQAPYRWNSADPQAGAVSTAEVVGKQLVGKKAKFGGDDVKSQTRKFGVVYPSDEIDYQGFLTQFGKYGGKVASEGKFAPNLETTEIASQATTMVTRMKAAGVTTVINFTQAPTIQPLMEAAEKQDWTPEWFFSGVGYADLGIIVRGYPTNQSKHTFGLSFIYAWTEPETVTPPAVPYATQVDPLNWYWGQSVGTGNARIATPIAWWLMAGIQAAGPNLTPKTFKQGLFALPPHGGALEDQPDSSSIAYGKGPKLPYDEYALSGYDFAPFWWDTETTGPSNGLGISGKGVGWFVDGGKRYVATTWPKKQFAWFDKDTSVFHFVTPPTPHLGYAGDCEGCPSQGGPGTPEAPSDSAVIFKAGGSGGSAAG